MKIAYVRTGGGGGGSRPMRTHCVQGGGRGGSKIGKFLRTYFMDGPLLFLKKFAKYIWQTLFHELISKMAL